MNFLDGEMSADEESHLREHLSGCPPCVDFLKTYRATPTLCKRALARQMPEELSGKLTEYLRQRIKPQS
jgi:anti-sigma factor RsiW